MIYSGAFSMVEPEKIKPIVYQTGALILAPVSAILD